LPAGKGVINVSERHKRHNHKGGSAFRAVSTESQAVPADTSVKVFFKQEEFDLGREYDRCDSIFIPRKNGIYLVTGTIGFIPGSFEENYRTRVEIIINGDPFEAADNDFWGTGVTNTNAVQVTAILKLEADDKVEIYTQSSIAGITAISQPGLNVTAFAASMLQDC
jgi:hypothetical protein